MDEDAHANVWVCWSCCQHFDRGISIDESGVEHVCLACWAKVPVTSRLVLGLLFRRLDNGGLGLQQLFEDAARTWPFSARPSNQ